MALDEPKDDDAVQQEEGFQFIMNRSLLDQVGGVTVDYLKGPFRKGFQIRTAAQETQCGSGGCSC